ncbi:MAG: undecaprenyl/decaprenyl-phosphate alpha-N-acetylglucosaminyl 1-phosphate transferase [Actinobacteria bacterium]|nr:undecaprenyl/decaprenyl-phosphate alpha-N-acetylglucosaminyl 1-phosphate transferase [Actinomycetota bacterium]
MSWWHYLVLLGIASAVTFIATPFVRRFAISHNVVDYPGGRRVNTQPTPRLGGVAIFLGVTAALIAQIVGEYFFDWGGPFIILGEFQLGFLGVAFGLFLIFLTGLLDDFVELSPGIKFLGQIVAAVVIVASGLQISVISNPFAPGLVSLGIAAYPITILYLVAFANVINLIDGLDGLAAGITVIATTSLFLLAAALNRQEAAVLAVALIGACLAFLRYNSHPASIFMGDSGALTLGFGIGVISLLGVTRSTATIALAVPLIVVGIPIIDTASAIFRRLKEGRPIQQADKGHIHHRLLRRGYGQRKTVFIIYGWSVVLAVGGYLVATMDSLVRLIAFIVLSVVSALIIWRLNLWGSAVEPHRGQDRQVTTSKHED